MLLKRVCTIIYERPTVSIGFAGYIKYVGVLLIEGNARASEIASAHSQDEAHARDFEGDSSFKKNTPKGWR